MIKRLVIDLKINGILYTENLIIGKPFWGQKSVLPETIFTQESENSIARIMRIEMKKMQVKSTYDCA
jgi:hypothetical protein